MKLHLEDKLVLVTGSTLGIGRAIAQAFLREGARVIVNGRDQAKVDEVVQRLSQQGRVGGIAADLSTQEGTNDLIKGVSALGEVNVLVNNVGIFEVRAFEETTDDQWLHYFNVNVMSAVRLCRHYLPRMLGRNEGRILNISSEAGVKPISSMIPYSVTKTALISLARGMAELTKGTDVTVNSVLPGPTWTEGVETFVTGAARAENANVGEFVENYFKVNEPTSLTQRFARVEEVADTVVFLSSKNASAINGAAQHVEGGIIRAIV